MVILLGGPSESFIANWLIILGLSKFRSNNFHVMSAKFHMSSITYSEASFLLIAEMVILINAVRFQVEGFREMSCVRSFQVVVGVVH